MLRSTGLLRVLTLRPARRGVNNAGTEGKPGPLTDQTAESLRRDIRHECTRHIVEHEA